MHLISPFLHLSVDQLPHGRFPTACLSPPVSCRGNSVSTRQSPWRPVSCPGWVASVPSVTAVCSLTGIRLSVYRPPRGHRETATFDLLHPRCYEGVCVLVVFLLSVYLFVSACVPSAGFPGRSVRSNAFTGDFSCNYMPISESQQLNLTFVSVKKHTQVLWRTLACLHTFYK